MSRGKGEGELNFGLFLCSLYSLTFLHDEKMYCLCGESLARLLSISRRKEGDEFDCHEYGIGRSWDFGRLNWQGKYFRQD